MLRHRLQSIEEINANLEKVQQTWCKVEIFITTKKKFLESSPTVTKVVTFSSVCFFLRSSLEDCLLIKHTHTHTRRIPTEKRRKNKFKPNVGQKSEYHQRPSHTVRLMINRPIVNQTFQIRPIKMKTSMKKGLFKYKRSSTYVWLVISRLTILTNRFCDLRK